MKLIKHSATVPQKPALLFIFWTLAFLPAILHLVWHDFLITNPLAALGPLVAGFWFTATVREIRVNFAVSSLMIITLLWSANWLMVGGHTCCSTIN